MASIPGATFNITGASGSQGLLAPKQGWKVYILPRGGFASADSTGTQITLDSAAIAQRFALNNWIQVGLDTSKIRKIITPASNKLTVLGGAVTVTKGDRIFCIGNTQPTVSGGSATYTIPLRAIRSRDDDGADIVTNAMLTSDANGQVQFWADIGVYDAIIQDGNQSAQGFIVDIPVGAVEGVSTGLWAYFGVTATFQGAIGVTGTAKFGATATFNAAMGVTGWATFGSTVTMNSTLGVTGTASFGTTIMVTGVSGNYSQSGTVVFGNTVTLSGALGVTGQATFGATITAGLINARWLMMDRGTPHTVADYNLTGWGTGSTVTLVSGESNYDTRYEVGIFTGTTVSNNPSINFVYKNGPYPNVPIHLANISCTGDTRPVMLFPGGTTSALSIAYGGSPLSGVTYYLRGIVIG